MRIIIDNNEYTDVLFRETYNNVPFDIAKAIYIILSEFKEITHKSEKLDIINKNGGN